MLSTMWRVGRRRVGGFHMTPNEPGKVQVALQQSAKKGPECNIKPLY